MKSRSPHTPIILVNSDKFREVNNNFEEKIVFSFIFSKEKNKELKKDPENYER